METPTITTARLILRPFVEADAGPLHRILNGKEVLRYFPNPDPPPLERVQRFVARQIAHWDEHGYGWWAVEPREPRSSQELIGWNGLQFLPETGEIEVGYLLSRTHWGQGFATEGGLASLQFSFQTLGLERIIAIVHPDNRASQRVIEKLGMSLVERTNYFGMDCFRYILDRHDYHPKDWARAEGEKRRTEQMPGRAALR